MEAFGGDDFKGQKHVKSKNLFSYYCFAFLCFARSDVFLGSDKRPIHHRHSMQAGAASINGIDSQKPLRNSRARSFIVNQANCTLLALDSSGDKVPGLKRATVGGD